MAPRRKAAPVARMLATAAALGVAGLVAVALIVPSPRPGNPAASKPAASVQTARAPTMPSYVVRIPPPAPARPAEPLPAPVSLSVQPVAAAAEPEVRTEKWYVTARALNIRAEPNSQSQPVGALPRGTAVDVSGREGNWAKVVAGDVSGWAFIKYISQTAP